MSLAQVWGSTLEARIRYQLTRLEPRCVCGHPLTDHSSRRLICRRKGPFWGRWPGCGCQGWRRGWWLGELMA